MSTYRVTVIRHQKWVYDIEADDKEDAIAEAETNAETDAPHDDWAYSTEAQEDRT